MGCAALRICSCASRAVDTPGWDRYNGAQIGGEHDKQREDLGNANGFAE